MTFLAYILLSWTWLFDHYHSGGRGSLISRDIYTQRKLYFYHLIFDNLSFNI